MYSAGYMTYVKLVVPMATFPLMESNHHTIIMKSTKVQTLGGIWQKYWNIWIENTFACICTVP